MSLEFKIRRDFYEEKDYIFKRSTLILEPGITCLVGRNGSGKSTVLLALKELCEEKKIPHYKYDNYSEGGGNAMEMYGFMGNFEGLATCFSASEGQRIVYNFGNILKNISSFIHRAEEKAVILIDAIDSGLDIENVQDVKTVLNYIIRDNPNKELYFVLACNNYELIEGQDCVAVENFTHKRFNSYEEFKKFILTRDKK